jgi:hypothetical protein
MELAGPALNFHKPGINLSHSFIDYVALKLMNKFIKEKIIKQKAT